MASPKNAVDRTFVRRTLFVFAVAAFIFICWQLADVALLVLGAVIVAVLLRSLADPLRDHTPLNEAAALAASGITILGVLAGAGWLFGATVSGQVQDLFQRLPHSMAELRTLVASLPFGQELSTQLDGTGGLASRLQGVAGRVGGYAITVMGAAANLLVVVFAGIFFAISPRRTRDGVLMLLPETTAKAVREALDTSGRALRLWLLGTLADMAVVGILTGIGTALIGLPSPAALGLFAGLAAFVPIVGPIVSVIPGVLLALQQGPQMVAWTVFVYFAVQQIESNLFYPFIQRRAVNLPPALTLFGVVAFGLLLGPLGVVFATPLLVVLMVLTKMLYIRNTLGREVSVPGEPKPG